MSYMKTVFAPFVVFFKSNLHVSDPQTNFDTKTMQVNTKCMFN